MQLEFPAWPPRWPEIDAAVADSLRSGDWGRYRSETHRRLRKRLAELFRHPASEANTPANAPFPANVPFPADDTPIADDAPIADDTPIADPEKAGTLHVRLCCSGTAAIELALRAAGVGPGDEVIVAAYDYPGNFRCVELVGGRPVLVDVVPGGVTIDPARLEAAAGEKVKAVIVSHLYGQPAAWEAIEEICKRNGWVTIEDACQVPGMTVRCRPLRSSPAATTRPLGSLGDLAAISFGGGKLLTAGCGGALMTTDPRMASRLNAWIDRPSDSYPLSPLQATVLLPQIERLTEWNRQRQETVEFLWRHWHERFPEWTPVGPDTCDRVVARNRPTSAREETSPSETAYYKLAWFTKTSERRRSLIDKTRREGIPIGEGFRSMHRASERRCRRPSPLDHAARAGERVCVLDHRALMLPADRRQQLLDALTDLYARTV